MRPATQVFRPSLGIPGVKNAWQNVIIPRPDPLGAKYNVTQAAKEGKALRKSGVRDVVHINGTSDITRPLEMTGVDQLHKLGIKGKGVKVGIVDTGVDYLHPALGGGFGEGFKVAGGRDPWATTGILPSPRHRLPTRTRW